ncbi:tripartite tricarboxylate transporter substrate binding protein [Alcaligenes sp. 13f]|uniref:Bug family tripartite tricarboxylate transporter substrate binding protein n=1 Tax=Alcaligenes sp. 13f TaxID=2841924 RepID=UPI001CF6BAE4|nr:tripartite tricarboxylate transporter substrate binding protein [Alcaligenes sp. 13f]MCB4321974.1 tripartite tricarboxylate transporter substrate binding protein [Alcaligenes sp. 13f]
MFGITRRTLRIAIRAGIATLLITSSSVVVANDDDYPNRSVRLIVPFPAGGASDLMGRIMGEQLGKQLGQAFVVENKAGAGGIIGTSEVARAKADGYTLLLSGIGSNAILHGYKPAPKYDSKKDFVHISQLAAGPNVFVVHPSFPAQNFQEFIAYAKENPGVFNYGQVNASSGHLSSEYLKQAAGIDIVGIPYSGSAPALTDVLSNQISGMFTNQDSVYPYVQSGRLRALAVTGAERNPLFPDVPTVAESGYPGFQAVSWFGLSAPAGTPQVVLDKLEKAMQQGFADPAVRSRLEQLGFAVVASNSQDFSAFVSQEIDHWMEVIRASGIQFD